MVRAIAGGVLVGVGLLMALAASGRIVGVSGVLGGLMRATPGEVGWRLAFVAGLLGGGALLAAILPNAITYRLDRTLPELALAGLLVGYGTSLGNGCTSGHGVCGVGRLSPRSLVATALFVASGAATVIATRALVGGRP